MSLLLAATTAPPAPVFDFSGMRHAVLVEAATITRQLAAPFITGLYSAAEFSGLVLLGLVALTILVMTLRTGEFTTAVLGIAVTTVLLILLAQLLSVIALTWSSIGLGFGVIAVCLLGGWKMARRLLTRLL